MNILFISDFAPQFPGSFFESLYSLSKNLKEKGNNIFFIFPLEREYIKRLQSFGQLFYCPSFLGRKLDVRLLSLVFKICRKEKIQIVHTNFGFAAPFTASLLSKFLRFQHVAHERSLSIYYNDLKIKKFKKIKVKVYFQLIQFFSNTIYIAISEGVRESLINYNGIKKKEIKIIPNAVLPERSEKKVNPEKIKVLDKIKKESNHIVGMTAHLGPQKDHITLIKAAEIIINKKSNTYFVLIGANLVSDNLDYREFLEEKVREKRLEKHFLFLGSVQDPFPYIEYFDIGCLISNWEGFGNALVEYMLKEKPVIGTAVGGIKDIIDDNVNGYLIPAKDSDLLAEKILLLLEDDKLAIKMGKEGYKKATKVYNMNNWTDQIIILYEEFV